MGEIIGIIVFCFLVIGAAAWLPIMAQKLVEANCPYLKVGVRVPNLNIDDSQEQLRFA